LLWDLDRIAGASYQVNRGQQLVVCAQQPIATLVAERGRLKADR